MADLYGWGVCGKPILKVEASDSYASTVIWLAKLIDIYLAIRLFAADLSGDSWWGQSFKILSNSSSQTPRKPQKRPSFC